MHLGGTDYKLLEIFVAVADAKGISNAQTSLARDASTISRAMTQLEERLGIRLCCRGRQGFSLTSEGREVYSSSVSLLAAFRRLEGRIELIKGVSEGQLKIATIDNILSDPSSPVTAALKAFSRENSVQTSLNILTPEVIAEQLQARQLDVGISIFEEQTAELEYVPLYQERDYLYCASDHPLARLQDSAVLMHALKKQRFVTRKFLDDTELTLLGIQMRDDFVHTDNIEAVTQLVLSGQCIGFIPHHYAAPWEASGLLRPILKQDIRRSSTICAATLSESFGKRPAVEDFLRCLTETPARQISLQVLHASVSG